MRLHARAPSQIVTQLLTFWVSWDLSQSVVHSPEKQQSIKYHPTMLRAVPFTPRNLPEKDLTRKFMSCTVYVYWLIDTSNYCTLLLEVKFGVAIKNTLRIKPSESQLMGINGLIFLCPSPQLIRTYTPTSGTPAQH